MTLEDCIKQIREGIKSGRFVNEASVSQGIVLPILQILEWPVFDTQIVCPEYSVQGKRVDFALCHPPRKPAVFIEVKRVGQKEGADEQLFRYAFHEGVPMAVLTDGQEWLFYLPAERGNYEERCAYKLDLVEREIEDSSGRLKRYLEYKRVATEESVKAARADYKNVAKNREMKNTLPKAWRRLLEEQDELLVDLLAEAVEDLCGYKPDADLVSTFLLEQLGVKRKERIVEPTRVRPQRKGHYGFILNGRELKCRNKRDVLTRVLEELSAFDSSFLDRFMARKHGRKRRYVARTKEELYPGRPDLCRQSHQLKSGYWVGTNYSGNSMRKILEIAAEVAGIRFGSDLVVYLGEAPGLGF